MKPHDSGRRPDRAPNPAGLHRGGLAGALRGSARTGAPPRHPLRLGPQRRWALYGLVALLLLTGAAWLWLHRTRAEDALPSPLEPWTMKLHGGAAMLLIYLAGTMLHGHMANAWRARRNRGAGAAVAAVWLLLATTGYGLYYFDGEALRGATEWLHWALGFASAPLLGWHIWRGRLGSRAEHQVGN